MKIALALLALALCSCGSNQPAGPTPEESDQLNAAEALLNEEATADGHR